MGAGMSSLDGDGYDGDEDLLIRAIFLAQRITDRPGEWREAAESLASEAQRSGHVEAEVVARRAAAWAARELYDHEAAEVHLDRAQAQAQAHGLRHRLGEVLITRSSVHLERGDVMAAERMLRTAREAFAPAVPLELAFADGLVAQKAGRAADAVAAYRHVLDTAVLEQDEVSFKAANNLGELLTELGRLGEAEAVLAHAAELGERLSAVFGAIVAVNRAGLAVQRGRLATAEALYARSEDLARQARMPLTEIRFEQVAAFRAAGLWAEAAGRLDALVREFERPGTALLRAEALLLLAEAALRNGDAERANTVAAEAVAAFAAQRRRTDRSSAEAVRAEAALALAGVRLVPTCAASAGGTAAAPTRDARTSKAPSGRSGDGTVPLPSIGRLRSVASHLEEHGELARAVAAWLAVGRLEAHVGLLDAASADWTRAARLAAGGPLQLRVHGHLARALAAPTPEACRRACAVGLRDLTDHRVGVASTELRARLAAHARTLAEVALAASPRPCPPALLLRWWDVGHAAGAATSPVAPPTTVAEDLAALRRASRPEAMGERDAADERRRLIEQRRLEARVRRRAWSDVASDTPGGAAQPGRTRLLRVADLGTALGDRPIVYYGALDDGLLAVVVVRGRARRLVLGPLATATAASRSIATAMRHLTSADEATAARAAAAASAALDRLDAIAGAPVRAALGRRARGGGELVVVPPTALASVPWNGLPSFADRPVRIVSSAREWLATAGDGPVLCDAAAATALVSAPDLPGAEDEVVRIAARRPAAVSLAREAATGARVAEALKGVVLAHVACHGTLRPDAPLFSALHLADGPFTVYDLEQVQPLPHVMVLAACNAGLVVPPIEGSRAGQPLGFVTVLLERGTRAVVAAAVPVPDLETSSLMLDLHDGLLAGASTAEALHRACASVDTSTPFGLATALAFSCFGGG